jgi:hypothetical protein
LAELQYFGLDRKPDELLAQISHVLLPECRKRLF